MVTTLLIVLICFITKTSSVENVYSDNGWRPISIENVDELGRNFIKTPANVHFPAERNFPESPDNLLEKRNDFARTTLNTETIDGYSTDAPRGIENYKSAEDAKGIKKSGFTIDENFRRAKKFVERKISALNNALTDETVQDQKQTEELFYEKENNKKTTRPNNIYEVKEVTDSDLLTSDQNLQHHRRYFYEPFKLKTSTSNNLTSNLFSILANYNIRTSDKLPNYALSLRPNSRNSDNHDFVYVHVPIKIPLRYNNANHLPLDPLLAVFLSNYGHYIPGLYGYPRGFSNLYGNLASNNIHNNKPFGSYKLFSDTDNSNS
ncbi:hypothetical protein KGM_211469 [Danaus plexippus plexippus]|uniref:Uncharacterized protein n=1 Tax=Danaus plexippus plexippus TaxID=278856 RepID=A0A212F0B0_DANPL|nr:hypothetical protein KGM_211469 [Danaus plexippus plexippus]